MLRLAVLVSGGGTNLQAILDGIDKGTITNAKVSVVVSNNKNAYALTRAQKAGIPAVCVSPKDYENREAFNRALLETIQSHQPDLVVLAGCLVVIPPEMVEAYPNRIINIHPALIPSFCGTGYYGLKVHEAALARGGDGSYGSFCGCGYGHGPHYSAEGGGNPSGRYPGGAAAAGDGTGGVGDYAQGH